MARALVNVPKTARRMETGYRPGPNGRILPRDIITRFTCTYGGQVVFDAELFPATSANPYLVFTTVAAESGPITLTWSGDNGFRQVETVQIEVT